MIYPRTPSCSGLSAAYRGMYGSRRLGRYMKKQDE